MFIRESKQFAEIVQKIRTSSIDGKEDTGTTFVGTRTITQGTDELTMTPPPVTMSSASQPVQNPEVLETKPPAVYGSPQDPKFKVQFETEKKRTALGVWLLFLVLLLGFVAFQFLSPKKVVKNLGYDEYISVAQSFKKVGNYEKSLEYFRRAETIRPLDIPHQVQMIPLLMAVENQNLQARQMLENISGLPDLSAQSQYQVENLIALSYFRDGRLDEAQKRYFEIIQKNPKNEAAQINLAEISVLQGQFDVASENLTALLKSGFKDPVLLLFRILVTYRTVDDKAKLESTKADLKRLVQQHHDYRNEMLLLLAAIQKKLNQDLDAGDTLRTLLNLNPDMTRLHVHDYMIHKELLEWVYLGNICEILTQEGGSSPVYLGLTAYCTYQQNDLKSAVEKIEKARAQFGNDQTLIGLQAFLLYKSNHSSEAKALLQLPKANESDLAILVQASLCEDQKDWSCAEAAWKKIHQNDPKNLAAFAGLTKVYLKYGQKEEAHDYLKQGLLVSNHYRPFLEMREEINAK